MAGLIARLTVGVTRLQPVRWTISRDVSPVINSYKVP